MAVYRRPFDYAPRQVARVEWQPQPSWIIDATLAEWAWTTYAATVTVGIPCTTAAWAWRTYATTITVSGDVDIAATTAALAWSGHRATIVSSREIACATAEWAWTGQAATVTATLLTIPVARIQARSAQNSMSGRASQNRIFARVA